MLSCARGFARLYFCDDRAPLLQAHLRALPGGGRPAGETMEPAHRPAAVEEAAPLQRAGQRARGGQRRDALAAPQGTGTRRGGPATRDRRATHPGRIPPDRQGSRARARHRRTRALGRAVDVADRIFLETTRRFASARLAREDVSTALTLVQIEPGKPIAARPHLRYEEDVPGLGRIVEESEWDAKGNVDRVRKTLHTPAGENLSATFSIRYYAPPRLVELAGAAGFLLRRLEPEAPLTEETPQLIALLEKVP